MYDRKQGRDRAYKKKEILQEIKKMKKTIVAILIIAIAAFSCFAEVAAPSIAEDGIIQLQGTVLEHDEVTYTLQAKMEEDGDYSTGDITGIVLSTSGTVNVQVVETSIYNMKDQATRSLKVTVTDFTNTYSSDTVSLGVTVDTAVNGTSDDEDLTYSAVTIDGKIVTWTCTYAGHRYINVSDQLAGQFNVNWTGSTTLAAGDYTSTITLEIVD